MMDGPSYALGVFSGMVITLAILLIAASLAGEAASGRISQSVVQAGWGQSEGKIYRVIPAEVTEVGR